MKAASATVLVIVGILVLGVVTNHVGEVQGLQRGKRGVTKVKLCGNQLVNMLRIICSHRGNKREQKRTKEKKIKKKAKKYKDMKKVGKRNRNKIENKILKERKRSQRRQGMVSRCCFSSCTIEQLYKAC